MESKNLTEALLSYYAIYDQDLREEMEDLGYFDEARDGYGDDSKFNKPDDRIKRPGTDVPSPKKGGYGRITSVMPKEISGHATRTISANTRVRGEDPGAPRSQKIATTTKMVKGKDGKWKKVRVQAEELDAYDIVLMHLIDEGYASHPDAAEAIMSNMSEEWIENIVEDRISDLQDKIRQKKASGATRRQLSDLRNELQGRQRIRKGHKTWVKGGQPPQSQN